MIVKRRAKANKESIFKDIDDVATKVKEIIIDTLYKPLKCYLLYEI